MLGALSLKWKWRERREKAGKSTEKPNLVFGGDVHVVWDKFCRYFDVEPRIIPLQPDKLTIGPEDVHPHLDENTIGVGAVLGTTFTGHADDIEGINRMLLELKDKQGLDIPLHVDAASGGFVWPFLYPDTLWDFRLEQVRSINVSGHKYGLAPLGVGWVVWRDTAELPEELIFRVNYLGGEMPTFGINFSRPGSQVVCQYYNFLRLGREGYRRVQQDAQDVALHLADRIEDMGPFRMITRGTDLPLLSWSLQDGANFTLFELSDGLRRYGWQVPAYTLPAHLEDMAICRIVVRQGLSMDLSDLLLNDFQEVLDRFAKEPERQPSAIEDGGFSHT
jgi:glutamate decarboxylase